MEEMLSNERGRMYSHAVGFAAFGAALGAMDEIDLVYLVAHTI